MKSTPTQVPARHYLLGALILASLGLGCLPPAWGAAMLLHPDRTPVGMAPALPHENISFKADDGAVLKGWLFRTTAPRRGLLVYLHGLGDNRSLGARFAKRFLPQGWDVLAYDARAHGESGGAFCSYGVLERRDLSRALDAVQADHVLLFGSSLGAAVALQAAAVDPRVRGVIAQSSFADLRSIAHAIAPMFATSDQVEGAFVLAEKEGHFQIDDASPLKAAASIQVPVLLIHGTADREVSPDCSRAIFAALRGPRQLVLVPGAGHGDVLAGPDVWKTIESWIAAQAW